MSIIRTFDSLHGHNMNIVTICRDNRKPLFNGTALVLILMRYPAGATRIMGLLRQLETRTCIAVMPSQTMFMQVRITFVATKITATDNTIIIKDIIIILFRLHNWIFDSGSVQLLSETFFYLNIFLLEPILHNKFEIKKINK